MKGLLTKDFTLIKNLYGKNILLVLVLYFILSIAMGMPALLLMFCWMAGYYVVNLYSVDGSSGWDIYANCLPVTRKQIVSSRYIMLVCCLVAGGAATSVLMFLLSLAGKAVFLEQLAAVGAVLIVSLGLFGLTLLLAIKFGPEKARMLNSILFLGLFGIMFLLIYAVQNTMDAALLASIAQNAEALLMGGLIGVGILCVAIFGVCWALAIRIYETKEF